ncbi:PilN domain-containing protein [Pseudoxanthomonas sp. PXM01]|uniref:PilN domain-containing protein n=1 Tax=Pseudoxanthomonas sp. PXM01 TaxID=2769295 RepID=UPI00177DE8F8|nr:PilN domain-containing protein [Pseudoxanthomonas sp. PXM01]MBD9468824.1 PilN domain-containing protein [Pseudoxanthomonas sp. PXM01]
MSGVRDTLQRLRARLGPGPRSFLAWWGQALATWLPARWRVLLGLTGDRLLFQRQDDQIEMTWLEGSQRHMLARLPATVTPDELRAVLGTRLTDLPRWWLVPSGMALRRRLLMPAAAAERLQDVLKFELDRQTPFTANEACFDARVIGVRTDGQLDVELAAVPMAAFAGGLAQLGALADGMAGADVEDADGVPLGVNLLPESARVTAQAPQRGLHRVLAAVAVVAIVFAAWAMLDNRRAAADAFAAQVDGRADAARQVAAQRQQLVDLVAGTTVLNQTSARRPTALEVMDDVTRRLPDNTYLEKFAIEGDRLTLIGFSPEASGLVARLQGSPLWRNPALSGALQPDPRTRMDRFTLTAELLGKQDPSAATAGGANAAGRD